MNHRVSWGEVAVGFGSVFAAWAYDVLPWIAAGIAGGLLRVLFSPPEKGVKPWTKIIVRSSLVGLLVGPVLVDLAELHASWWWAKYLTPGVRGAIVAFFGFGAASFLELWDDAWNSIRARPGRLFRWLFRRPPLPPGPPANGEEG